MPERTTETILARLKEIVENKIIVPPDTFIDAAEFLIVLLGDEHDKLFELQQRVAQAKIDYLGEDPKENVSKAKAKIEATDIFKEMQKQRAKISRIEEYIRISKIRARLKDTEMRGY